MSHRLISCVANARRRHRSVSVSPWSNNNVSVTTFGILAAAWFIAVQLFASGVGGYLAGRLRTRWVSVHTDEVYFRDTAHGLIVWGVGAIVTAWLLTSGAASVVSGAAHAGGAAPGAAGTAVGAPAAQAAGQAASSEGSTAYFADMLFALIIRIPRRSSRGAGRDGTILATDALSGEMPAVDKAYVAQVVAARTGSSQADADKRVSEVVEQAKNAKDKAIDTAKAAATRPVKPASTWRCGRSYRPDRRVFRELHGDGRRARQRRSADGRLTLAMGESRGARGRRGTHGALPCADCRNACRNQNTADCSGKGKAWPAQPVTLTLELCVSSLANPRLGPLARAVRRLYSRNRFARSIGFCDPTSMPYATTSLSRGNTLGVGPTPGFRAPHPKPAKRRRKTIAFFGA